MSSDFTLRTPYFGEHTSCATVDNPRRNGDPCNYGDD
jgi:hypothetical protein